MRNIMLLNAFLVVKLEPLNHSLVALFIIKRNLIMFLMLIKLIIVTTIFILGLLTLGLICIRKQKRFTQLQFRPVLMVKHLIQKLVNANCHRLPLFALKNQLSNK
ncbi:hypothetical protein D5E81_25115 [Vibrio parahaemolyticus]|nr:hypothetical protein D5E79_25830 [Vibrio parahaemolyticus]TBT37241.1 hypothetical protein D5E81_25115 [Vibrio parahaemolyticus]